MEPKRKSHCVHLLTYHLVLSVKYRRPCIDEDVKATLISQAAKVLANNGGELLECNAEADHLHILFEMKPGIDLAKFVGVLKGSLSKTVRIKHKDKISPQLWGDSFWSDSYFITTTGGASLDVVKQYIESQGRPKRKYVRKKCPNSSPT